MRKLLTLILVLCSVVGFAQMRGGAQYDPGAARANLSNVDAAATPSMTSITLSDKVRAAWADILGDIYASGTVKVSTGTAVAPAYSFASDPNTGIYSPAADNLAVSVAGAEALRVNSAGEVLITTSTDAGDYKLQVNGNAYVNGNILSFGNNTQIVRNTVDASDNGYLQISGGGAASNSRSAYITLNGNESATPGVLNLSSGNVTGSAVWLSPTAGDVLVGTTTDAGDYKLQVSGNAYVNGSIRSTGNGAFGFGTVANPSIGFIDSNDGFYKLSADNFFAGINGTSVMGFDNNGVYMNNGVFRLLAKTPASATDTGITGTICFDGSYIYICTATNTWRRVAISSW